MMLQEDYCNKN